MLKLIYEKSSEKQQNMQLIELNQIHKDEKEMNHLLESIDNRISRRTYLDSPVESNKLDKLIPLVNKFNQEANLRMELIVDGGDGSHRTDHEKNTHQQHLQPEVGSHEHVAHHIRVATAAHGK